METKRLTHTINSRRHGHAVTFLRPERCYYVRADLRDTGEYDQVCHGGTLRGQTIMYGSNDQAEFSAMCRQWWRAYLARTR